MALGITKIIEVSYMNERNTIENLTQYDKTLQETIIKSITATDIYTKIDKIEGNNKFLKITICFLDKKDGVSISSNVAYTFTPSVEDTAANFYKQGYEYLKTLDEYADAIDLLEDGQTV